ncbi:MAG: YlmC/YmxH family sporulation protein [Bacillota bacterium]
MKKSDLMLKEVVDIKDGKFLGYIDDVDIDIENGRIMSVILARKGVFIFHLFSNKDDLIISWDKIRKVGEDVILVNV